MSEKKEAEWQPTGGQNFKLDAILNQGMGPQGQPVFIHFTSLAGYNGILGSGKILVNRNAGRKLQQAKTGIYLNPPIQSFDPATAHTMLFFENETYKDASDYCFIFCSSKKINVNGVPITGGSWVKEMIYYDSDIVLTDLTMFYQGANPFIHYSKQGSDYSDWVPPE